MDLTKKRYDISYDTDETVTTEDTGYYTGTITAGTLQPGYGAVPPTYSNVTITGTGTTTAPIYGYNPVEATWSAANRAGTKIYLEGESADIDINGKSLVDTLQALEERLNILVPNPKMEKEWSELKQLGDAYRKLEADLIEKGRMWQALQKTS